MTIGMKYSIPMMFCTHVMVRGLYSFVSLISAMEYPTATKTAPLRNRMPLGEAVNSRFLLSSMTMTPANETIKPTMFMGVSRSLRKMRAAMGVTKGIMAMMADPMTGEEFFRP